MYPHIAALLQLSLKPACTLSLLFVITSFFTGIFKTKVINFLNCHQPAHSPPM
jgi:hypothetical protein